MKPYYSDDAVTLYHGDCRDVLRGLTWDACITDPPYGVDLGNTGDPRGGSHGLNLSGYAFADTYEHFVREIVPRLNEALDRSRRAVVFTGPHIHEQKKPDAIGGIYCPGACARNGWGFKTFLPVLLYGKSPTVAQGKGATVPTTLRSSIATERHPNGHPVPKPLEWMKWAVSLGSLHGETVCDPFAGSGTTLRAAKDLGRRAIGVEIDERYCEIAAERMGQNVLDLGGAA